MTSHELQHLIYSFYKTNKRILPWRWEPDPYKIFVSEVMLQQTQVSRVLVSYPQFISRFPSFELLAKASLSDVLTQWQGMGYNRRGKYLRDASQIIVNNDTYSFLLKKFNIQHSTINNTEGCLSLLKRLPGIGHATASAILTYAYNFPTVFIETNIRSVFLYHYFPHTQNVFDNDIMPLIEKTLDLQNPRDWYYALTDYGAYLKTKIKFKNIASKHYSKQSIFEGSRRQMRGMILKTLLTRGPLSLKQIRKHIPEDERINSILDDLTKEKLIVLRGNRYLIDSEAGPE